MADINLSVPVLPGDDYPERDALHVPVVLVTAKTTIVPGCRITITREGTTLYGHFINPNLTDPLAPIANPFLKGAINAGSQFYALLPPGSDVKLVHSWTSPKVPDLSQTDSTESRKVFNEEVEDTFGLSISEVRDAIAYAENDGCRGCY